MIFSENAQKLDPNHTLPPSDTTQRHSMEPWFYMASIIWLNNTGIIINQKMFMEFLWDINGVSVDILSMRQAGKSHSEWRGPHGNINYKSQCGIFHCHVCLPGRAPNVTVEKPNRALGPVDISVSRTSQS